MRKTMLIYGGVVGAVAIGAMTLGMSLGGPEDMSSSSMLVGYLIMLAAFALIFPAVKGFRDREQGGVIRFGQAVKLGLGITAVAGVVYVIGWECYLVATDHAFIDQYQEAQVRMLEEKGLSAEELEAGTARIEAQMEGYRKRFVRMPITFTEPLPVGILVSLIAGLVLRRSETLPDAAPPPAEAAG